MALLIVRLLEARSPQTCSQSPEMSSIGRLGQHAIRVQNKYSSRHGCLWGIALTRRRHKELVALKEKLRMLHKAGSENGMAEA